MKENSAFHYTSEEPVFEEQRQGKVRYLTYPLLEHTGLVTHAFSTREGGVSTGQYATMNFSISQGDDPAHVRANFHRMGEAIGIPDTNMVCSQQTHTTNVLRVGKSDRGKGVLRPRGYRDVDGLITDEAEVCLVTSYADCVPLFFVDPIHKAIGLSHSGWRGTVAQMGAVTLSAMRDAFGTKPKDVVAAVGPSICQKCYEVSEDVIARFRENFPQQQWPQLFYQKENGKYQLDLWKANELVLTSAGVPEEQIAVTNLCTSCNEQLLFSHRASRGKRGAMCAFLMLKEEQNHG